MSDFNIALQYVLVNEGIGYEEPPEIDQPTNTGIIAADIATFRDVPISQIIAEDVKNLTMSDIEAIYQFKYWDVLNLSGVSDQGCATCIFDTGVNRGVYIGGLYAQRACNLLGSSLKVDGYIGPKTVAAINLTNRSAFISHYEALVQAGYDSIIAVHPEDIKYRNGWMARAQRLLELI